VQFWRKEMNSHKKSADAAGAIFQNGRNGGKKSEFSGIKKYLILSNVLVLQNASKTEEKGRVPIRNGGQTGARFSLFRCCQ
jgi:hypothetical protein